MSLLACKIDGEVREVGLLVDMPADDLVLNISKRTYSGERPFKVIDLNCGLKTQVSLFKGSSYVARLISKQPTSFYPRFSEVAIVDDGLDRPILSIQVSVAPENETLVTLIRSHLEQIVVDR